MKNAEDTVGERQMDEATPIQGSKGDISGSGVSAEHLPVAGGCPTLFYSPKSAEAGSLLHGCEWQRPH